MTTTIIAAIPGSEHVIWFKRQLRRHYRRKGYRRAALCDILEDSIRVLKGKGIFPSDDLVEVTKTRYMSMPELLEYLKTDGDGQRIIWMHSKGYRVEDRKKLES